MIMNKENGWDHMTEGSMVKGPIKKVTREEMVIAVEAIKPGKTAGPSEVCAQIISASEEVEIAVMMELCQRVLDRKEMPDEWQSNAQIPIFKGKSDVRSCNVHRGVKLLEHAMIRLPYVRKILDMSGIQVFCPEIIINFAQMSTIFVIKQQKKQLTKNCHIRLGLPYIRIYLDLSGILVL